MLICIITGLDRYKISRLSHFSLTKNSVFPAHSWLHLLAFLISLFPSFFSILFIFSNFAIPSQIQIGSKVSACVGPLQDIAQEDKEKRKKRSKRCLFVTVVRSSADQKWTVYWDDISRASLESSSLLQDDG